MHIYFSHAILFLFTQVCFSFSCLLFSYLLPLSLLSFLSLLCIIPSLSSIFLLSFFLLLLLWPKGLECWILWWLLVWFWLVGCSGLVSMGLACGSDVHWCLVSMSMQCPSFETRFSQNRVKPYSDVFKRAYSNVLRTYSGIF